jgi:AAA domain-containing protein/bifunctional DNA primase/polymerase-like protein
MSTVTAATFTDRAMEAVRRGFSIIPCQPCEKAPLARNGAKSRTNTEEGVRQFAAQVPLDANYGICSDENYTILETDDREKFLAALGFPMPKTFCVSARPNRGYWIFKQTSKSRAVKTSPTCPGLFEWRHTNQYCVGFGSIHPETKQEYRLAADITPSVIEDRLVDRLLELSNPKPTPTSVTDEPGPFTYENVLDLLVALQKREPRFDFEDGKPSAGPGWNVRCWNEDQHSNPGLNSSTVVWINERGFAHAHCSHNHCGYGWKEFVTGWKIADLQKAITNPSTVTIGGTAPKELPAFRPQSLVDFMAQSYPPPEPLVENALYVGDFTSITGRRRNGKTTLLHNLALAGSNGDPSYLGLRITRPFKTLAFYFEDDPGDMQDKLRRMLTGRKASENFHLYTKLDFRHWELPMDLSDASFRTRILECCEAHRPDWVTFDNLGILIGADYNNAKAIHELVKFVWEIQSRFRCAVTVAAHPRKQSSDLVDTLSLVKNPNRFFEECMGSSHFINSTGAMWGIERDEGDRTYLVLGSQRVTGDYTVTVAEKDDNHWLHLVQDTNVSMGALLNTPKRKQAWFSLPDSFTFESGLEALAGNMSRAAFARWWGEMKRSKLIAPLEEGSKLFKKSDKAVITVE